MHLSTDKWIGIILIMAALLIWAPLPVPHKETIGATIVIAIGAYHFLK